MPLTYKLPQERESGDGSDKIAKDDILLAYYKAYESLGSEISEIWSKRFLKTPHRCSIFIKTEITSINSVIDRILPVLFDKR